VTNFAELAKCINFFLQVNKIVKLVETLNSLLDFSAALRFANRFYVKKEVAFAYRINKVFWVSAIFTCTIADFQFWPTNCHTKSHF
jgi:hypothetical protein